MSKVLVVLETAGGAIRSQSLPGITAGKQIADARGGELHLLVLGADASAAAGIGAAGYGAAGVHTLSDAALEPFTAEAWGDAVVHAAKTLGASVVGGTASSALRDCLPRAAAILDAPLCAEIVAVKSGDTFTRPISAGRALLDETLSGDVVFFTARGSEFEPAAAGAAAPVAAIDGASVDTRGVEVLGIKKTESARPALTEADVVVSGGRGMREGENFKILEELTDMLGGALGASRAATDAGMVPADLQVGQTGKIVAPNLYIAVAISGAIQHLAGMKGSKTIVAINKDPEAPIFQVADYGLVAKWEEALPELVAAVKARKG
ncbi:electron transfer flavoprotein subunit alpha/FixB family protein [Pseudenhygromyxa sp. WMMC2535]|uniref:electron transfer flavoprotein subunit alpha/FixB family protein n=1 Tax=Pseudenhygromyxa sp. WMMC2535 TaxID=2712867 RepID=UPI001555737D|nr:FAD-binding protein [Pseudenhygromyxa sp. WMMC2535]NVB43214.1 electron transfer flavoprotein subunit alpha/FixB family protein [Pseudenhygromyxa sp. WMMC2535]